MTIVWIVAAVMLTAAATLPCTGCLGTEHTGSARGAGHPGRGDDVWIGTWAAFSLDTTVTYGLTAWR